MVVKVATKKEEEFQRHLALAGNAHQAGNLERAVEEYRFATLAMPKDVESRNQIGVILYQMGKLTEACKYLERMVEKGPANVCTYNNLGVVYTELFQYDRAFWAFQKAKDYEKSSSVLINLARLFSSRRKTNEAVSLYDEAGSMDPNDPRAHYMHGIDCGFRSMLAVKDAFDVGQIVKVTRRSPLMTRSTNESAVYKSRIENMDVTNIMIQTPTCGGAPVPYRPGEEIVLVKEGKNCLWGMGCIIRSRHSGAQPCLILMSPQAAMRIQRRNFVRIPPWQSCKFSVISMTAKDETSIPVQDEGFSLINISAGGALLECEQAIPEGASLIVNLTFDWENRTLQIDLDAKVLRQNGQSVALMFANIEHTLQEILSRRVLKSQLFMRRMGKI